MVLAAGNYPGTPRQGDEEITVIPAPSAGFSSVFHAGTKRGTDGRLVTAGGALLQRDRLQARSLTAARARTMAPSTH